MGIRYKGKIVSVKSMSKKELADYMFKMKPSHEGYSKVVREYLKRKKR